MLLIVAVLFSGKDAVKTGFGVSQPGNQPATATGVHPAADAPRQENSNSGARHRSGIVSRGVSNFEVCLLCHRAPSRKP